MTNNSLSVNQELYKGEYLLSENGQYKAVFQDDGDFVVYTWTPVWQTCTSHRDPLRILLQEDTNLVMYTENDTAVWRTGTYTHSPQQRVRLTLTNDGHLNLRNDGNIIWSSETSKGLLI